MANLLQARKLAIQERILTSKWSFATLRLNIFIDSARWQKDGDFNELDREMDSVGITLNENEKTCEYQRGS